MSCEFCNSASVECCEVHAQGDLELVAHICSDCLQSFLQFSTIKDIYNFEWQIVAEPARPRIAQQDPNKQGV